MRRISPWISIPLIVFTLAMLLYPPYLNPRGVPIGHAFIFQPPPYSKINLQDLLVKIAIGHLALVLLYVTITQIKDSKKIDHAAIAEKTKAAIKSIINETLSTAFFLLKMAAFSIVAFGILIVTIRIFASSKTPTPARSSEALAPTPTAQPMATQIIGTMVEHRRYFK